MTGPHDIRDDIFASVADARVVVALTVERAGVVAGMGRAREVAAELGLTVFYAREDGASVAVGERVLLAASAPKQAVLAEECLVGLLAKTSGIATAAARAVDLARDRVQVVCGAWKKMPPELKRPVREAVAAGGGESRMVAQPFLYLDKNYVAMLGGVDEALRAVERWPDRIKVVQVRGQTAPITSEAEAAARGGAGVIMVDTGRVEDLEAVATHLRGAGLRAAVKLAFAGGIELDDIPKLAARDVDILDVGCAVIDAPLLDMRLDVVEVSRTAVGSGKQAGEQRGRDELNLLDKTELWVEDIRLCHVDLTHLASEVAEALGLAPGEVLVVDVRDDHVTLDILAPAVAAGDIAGKEPEILDRIARLPGVLLGPDAGIHSDGILGLIGLPAEEVPGVLARGRQMAAEIEMRVSRRALVFSSGPEVLSGAIRDTNTPLILERLLAAGYQAQAGGILEDDAGVIAGRLSAAAEDGYGLVITTGGVGAEDKDCTVEGVLRVDPGACCAWLVKYQKGSGRHHKEGVRIAVGRRGSSLFVALPGPTSEVELALAALLPGLAAGLGMDSLAEAVAAPLRARLRRAGSLVHVDAGAHGSVAGR